MTGKKSTTRTKGTRAPCSVPDCGRPTYARGLCQTHHRQMLTTGRIEPIRRYSRRGTQTVKFAGLRLTPFCADKLDRYAEERDLSRGAAIAALLEDWLVRQKRE